MRFQPILLLLFALLYAGAYAAGNVTIKTVVIDAGHGGKDPGAIGANKNNEKDVALAVALKLGNYIHKNFPDVNIIYTRQTDTFIELHERAEIANKNKADLFIAIHCNSSVLSQFYGTSTYVLGLHRTEANLEVAKRENSVILLEGDRDKHYEFDPNSPEGNIIMSMKQNAFLDQSIDIASKIENQFETSGRRKSLGVKQAGFYVLYKTTMPSLLSEIGFISNPDEEKFLVSANGQDIIANALFKAFKEYKFEMESHEGENAAQSDIKKPAAASTADVQPDTPDNSSPKSDDSEIKKEPVAKPIPPAIAIDSGIVTTKSGKKIRKPVESSSGGGVSPARPAPTPTPTPVPAPDTHAQHQPAPVNKTTKQDDLDSSIAAITLEHPVDENPFEPTAKNTPADNSPPPKVKAPDVAPSRPKDIPAHVKESGIVFKVQFLALMVPLKNSEHDKIIRVFNPVSYQTLPNGVTRYYLGDEKNYAAVKKLRLEAISQGYKDAFIVGFKNGERIGPAEMKSLEH